MPTRGRALFRDLTPENWQNLTLAAILGLFTFYLGWQLALGRLCTQIGLDYCDYRSAAVVARTHGYAAVYDLSLLDQAQKSMLPAHVEPSAVRAIPFPYLPVFVPPFQLLLGLPLVPGFIAWSTLSLALYWLYLRFFTRSLNLLAFPARQQLLMLASLPAFLTIYTGQVSMWQIICVGEFMRALMADKPFRGGLWLGGMLLKPQLLILLVPLLLLQRSFRTLAGLTACSILVGAGSFALIGTDGLVRVFSLWQTYAQGRSNNWIEGMGNFRMLDFHLGTIMPAWPTWLLTVVGGAVLTFLILRTWRQPFVVHSGAFPVAILAILAATVTVAWHSHIHMALVLALPMLLLHQRGLLPRGAVSLWVFAPSTLFLLAVFAPPALERLQLIPSAGARFVYFFFAAAQLAANLYLFAWATRHWRGAGSAAA